MSTKYPNQQVDIQSTLNPVANAATIITSAAIPVNGSVQIAPANLSRKGLIIWNQSANSIYISYTSPANSATNMTAIIPTYAAWIMPLPVYTGAIYATRNAGTGFTLTTELT